MSRLNTIARVAFALGWLVAKQKRLEASFLYFKMKTMEINILFISHTTHGKCFCSSQNACSFSANLKINNHKFILNWIHSLNICAQKTCFFFTSHAEWCSIVFVHGFYLLLVPFMNSMAFTIVNDSSIRCRASQLFFRFSLFTMELFNLKLATSKYLPSSLFQTAHYRMCKL